MSQLRLLIRACARSPSTRNMTNDERMDRIQDALTASVHTKGVQMSKVASFLAGVAAFWLVAALIASFIIAPGTVGHGLAMIR